ncbi:hypothetical protein H0H87_009768 [Tephrocybe sp. NHM501043]|nr:hypothetical protein H0H87_009768 [Tephrocybe sp. NHM501043]
MDSERVRIESHLTARSRAVATSSLVEGSTISVIPSLANVLIPSEKGYRCQSLQWKDHHRKLCKSYLSFTSSSSFQALASHEKLDALLLAHLLGASGSIPDISSSSNYDPSSPISVFLALLPGPDAEHEFKIPIPDLKPSVSPHIANFLYARFSNNNFAIHSHLSTVGHGVFPLASRLFNHSCYPNAAPKYLLTPNGVTMEVIALQEIPEGEEECSTWNLTDPTNTGVHLLELAKTEWNMFVSSEVTDPTAAQVARGCAEAFLHMGRKILVVFGQEGDAEGPLSEATTLQSLLES